MAESEPKKLIDFEWDLFDDEKPDTRVKPPEGGDEDGDEKPPEGDIEDDDWP